MTTTAEATEPKSTKADDLAEKIPFGEPPPIDMDDVLDRISQLVCLHGPMLLTRGMKYNEAMVAMLLCLESLHEKVGEFEKHSCYEVTNVPV